MKFPANIGNTTEKAVFQTADLLWQDVAGMVEQLIAAPEENCVYAVLKSGVSGNAVVAVKNADGAVVWSYHLWVADFDPDANVMTWTDSESGTSYKMMDRYVGAVSNQPGSDLSNGLFYQWGRKDPFARNLTATRPGGSPYESASSDLEKTEAATEATGTIAYATRNPQTRLLAAKEWYVGAGGNDLLWGGAKEGSVKTVYDPCPAGYRVPDARHFAEMKSTSSAECNANYGMLLAVNGEDTKSYFPTSGYLEANKHVTMYLEYRGYMWLNAGGATAENRFYFNNAGVNIKNESHAKGMAVRCVKTEQ